jgi:hypothetical protein
LPRHCPSTLLERRPSLILYLTPACFDKAGSPGTAGIESWGYDVLVGPGAGS